MLGTGGLLGVRGDAVAAELPIVDGARCWDSLGIVALTPVPAGGTAVIGEMDSAVIDAEWAWYSRSGCR